MSQAPVADYSIEVSTADQYQADVYFWTEQFTYDGTTDEISFTLPDSITDLGKYRVAIWPTGSPSQEGRASSSFWVLKPLRLSKEGTSALPFYPLVRDGYRDQATLRYGLNQDAATTVRVVDQDGSVRSGYQTSGTSRSQNCYANRFYYSGETNLDCWGGRFAQAVYGFKVPKTAYNISFRVGGHVNCCDRGVITRKGVRASGKLYRVTVRVTNWRSFTVERVKITYRWKQRI